MCVMREEDRRIVTDVHTFNFIRCDCSAPVNSVYKTTAGYIEKQYITI